MACVRGGDVRGCDFLEEATGYPPTLERCSDSNSSCCLASNSLLSMLVSILGYVCVLRRLLYSIVGVVEPLRVHHYVDNDNKNRKDE